MTSRRRNQAGRNGREKMTTAITTAQIRALATEAAAAGDTAMVRTCERALAGSARAMATVRRVIRAAAAMAD